MVVLIPGVVRLVLCWWWWYLFSFCIYLGLNDQKIESSSHAAWLLTRVKQK